MYILKMVFTSVFQINLRIFNILLLQHRKRCSTYEKVDHKVRFMEWHQIIDSARLGSARLGSARLGSARSPDSVTRLSHPAWPSHRAEVWSITTSEESLVLGRLGPHYPAEMIQSSRVCFYMSNVISEHSQRRVYRRKGQNLREVLVDQEVDQEEGGRRKWRQSSVNQETNAS
jgi:hypothetical protein